MIKKNIVLKSFTAGKKMKTFTVSYNGKDELLFADIDKSEVMQSGYNKFNIKNLRTNSIIHNLYPIDDINIRSSSKSHNSNNLSVYSNIYVPEIKSDMILKTVQFGDYTYILTKPTTRGFTFKYDESDVISSDNELETHLYNVYEDNTNVPLSSRLMLSINIRNIEYNYVIEIPNNLVYGFFNDKTVIGDAIHTKNHLGYNYSMNILSDDSNSDIFRIDPPSPIQLILFPFDYPDDSIVDFHKSSDNGFLIETNTSILSCNDNMTEQCVIYDKINTNTRSLIIYNTSSNSFDDVYAQQLMSDLTEADPILILYICNIDNYRYLLFKVNTSVYFTYIDTTDDASVPQRVQLDDIDINSIRGMYLLNINNQNRLLIWGENTLHLLIYDSATNVFSLTSTIRDIGNIIKVIFSNDIYLVQNVDNIIQVSKLDIVTNNITTFFKNSNVVEVNCIMTIEVKPNKLYYIIAGKGRTSDGSNYGYMNIANTNDVDIQQEYNDELWYNIDHGCSESVLYMALDALKLNVVTSGGKKIVIDFSELYDRELSRTSIIFSKNRLYTDINVCGGNLYLTYTTPIRYKIYNLLTKEGIELDISNLYNYTMDSDAIYDLVLLLAHKIDQSNDDFDKYEKVEIIKSINRFAGVTHKSNVYSIKINDNLFNNVDNDNVELIKIDIENNMRLILKTIAPANTLFIGINWEENI